MIKTQSLANSDAVLSVTKVTPLTEIVKQSPNDKRQYRVITLANGLRALLVADLEPPDYDKSKSSTDPLSEEVIGGTTAVASRNIYHAYGGKKNLGHYRVELSDNEDTDDDNDLEDGESDESDDMDHDGMSPPLTHASLLHNGKKGKDDDSEKLAAAALCVGVGSFCDPDSVPGLAHFLEHMVFMGSEKYPDENAFDSFIKKHGGSGNAFTDCERTVFYFDVERKHLHSALDIFAQFFIAPLMKRESVDREIQAIDSEFDLSKPSDSARKQQLIGLFAQPDSPMAKFMWGNEQTLKNTPKGVDVYEQLKEFHKKHYSAHLMALVVQAKEPLDTLESWVKTIFADVPNNAQQQPTFEHHKNCFSMPAFHRLYKVVPVKNVHQLDLTWHLPCLKHLYRSKPLHYIGWLTGHEGKGSILSYLRSKLWALSISSGNGESGWEHNSTGAMFSVVVTLTDQGLVHMFEVISVVFEYLEMLRQKGPQRRIYDEIKIIEDNEFQWKEQIDPSDYVEHLAEAMQCYSPEDYLTGNTLMFDFNPQAIEDLQKRLLPTNVNILFLSKNHEDPKVDFDEERWYHTKFKAADIPEEYVTKWVHLIPREGLHLPLHNDYIATDFMLKPTAAPYTDAPQLVLDTEKCRLWFKQDSKFKVPRGYLYFYIISPVCSNDARGQALFDLFVDCLSHNLQEVAYAAHVAQLEYEFKTSNSGLIIKMNGFSDKLPKLFATIVDGIANFEVTEQLFNALNEQLKKKYYNQFIKPEKLVRDLRLRILEDRFWTQVDRRQFLMTVTRNDLISFLSEFKRLCFIEGYVHGNFLLEEAMAIQQDISSKFSSSVLLSSMHPQNRVVKLPPGDNLCRVKSFNKNDSNSCVVNYYQAGPCNLNYFVQNELLNMMMDEPCFDILRTREQLGYAVFCATKNTHGVVGFCISVCTQASKFSVQLVDEKIEEFLVEFQHRLHTCSDKEFNVQRKSLISIKLCDDSHMGEEADRLWVEIQDQTYLFDRLDKEIAWLEKVTLDDMRRWCENLLAEDCDLRRKLSIQVVGYADTETDSPVMSSCTEASAHSSAPVNTRPACEEPPHSMSITSNLGNSVASVDTNRQFDFAFLEIEDKGDSSVITDIQAFKNTLALYPVCKVL